MAKNYLISSLDIGSSVIRCLAVSLKPDEEKLEVLSQVTEPSFGVRRGVIVNTEKVSETIRSVVKKTENEAGQSIENIFVNLGGGHVLTTNSRGTIAVSRADQKISEEDVERVIQAAQTFSLPPNRKILDVFPKEFIVDGEKEIKEPIGMTGVRLETEIAALCYFSPYFKNLTKSILDAGLQAHIVADPLAGSMSVLTPREKELGVLFLDIGAGTTGYCIYKEGALLAAGIVPIGSFHITKDIATGLETDVDTAERIKLEFGSCLLKGSKKIKTKELVSQESIVFSQAKLGQIIDARVSEIFQQINKEIKKISSPKMPGGVVLSGGGAKLKKIKDFSKKSLKLTSRVGMPKGFFPDQKDSSLACVCGLALKGKEIFEEDQSLGHELTNKIKNVLRNFVP